MGTRFKSQRGAALLLVLCVVSLLMTMAAALLRVVDVSTRQAGNALAGEQLQAVAHSALNRSLWSLSAPDPRQRPLPDGTFRPVRVTGGEAWVAVSLESGRVDLNASSPELLQALFEATGADSTQSGRLIRQIEASRRESGATLLSLADVLQFQDMSLDLYARLIPVTTVYTRSIEPDPACAPESVRQAMARLRGVDESGLPKQDDCRALLQSGGGLLRIEVKAASANGATFNETSIVRLIGDQRQPFWILDQFGPVG